MNMKYISKIAIALMAFAGLVSCEMQDEIKGDVKNNGETGVLELSVSVDASRNVVTKDATSSGTDSGTTVSAADFPVTITGVTDATYSKTFSSYSELQSAGAIELPVGSYKVSAHSPGELQKQMDEPYYSGEADFTITKSVTSAVEVTCTMQNMKISIAYTSMFTSKMESWTITITDANESDPNNLVFTGSNGTGISSSKYITVGENTSAIKVNVVGKRVDGRSVSESRSVTKPSGDDSEYWDGGDYLSITMDYSEDLVVPSVGGIKVTVDISFSEKSETIEIPVDPDDSGSTDPDTPGEETDSPTITSSYIDNPVTFKIVDGKVSGAPSTANVDIAAKAGLKSLVVKITSGNDGFGGALTPLGLDTGRDITSLDSDNQMDGILIEVLNPLPKIGDTSYSLDIAKFWDMMAAYGATDSNGHQFAITVTDANGKTATATLKVIINAE